MATEIIKKLLQMQKLIIKKAIKSNYEVLISLWEASVRATHHFLNERDINAYKKLILNKYFDQVDLYFIEDDQHTYGFVGIAGDNIQMLFIDPKSRGNGIGRKLMRFAIEEKKANKVDVNEQNEQALCFYKHLGFVITDRYENDDVGKPYPILSMELR